MQELSLHRTWLLCFLNSEQNGVYKLKYFKFYFINLFFSVKEMHLNFCSSVLPKTLFKYALSFFLPWLFVPKEDYPLMFPSLTKKLLWLLEISGYFHMQATKPDSIGKIKVTKNKNVEN